MIRYLNLISGLTGLAAALLWFLAAQTQPAPSQGQYYDVVDSPSMPFHVRWRLSGMFNQWAAGLTGVSVFLSALAQFAG